MYLLKGSRKRPRLEKGQEPMDIDIKKEDDIKSEPKGNLFEYYSFFSFCICKLILRHNNDKFLFR